MTSVAMVTVDHDMIAVERLKLVIVRIRLKLENLDRNQKNKKQKSNGEFCHRKRR